MHTILWYSTVLEILFIDIFLTIFLIKKRIFSHKVTFKQGKKVFCRGILYIKKQWYNNKCLYESTVLKFMGCYMMVCCHAMSVVIIALMAGYLKKIVQIRLDRLEEMSSIYLQQYQITRVVMNRNSLEQRNDKTF